MAAPKTAKADYSNQISFTGKVGDLQIVTRITLYTVGSDWMAKIERKPYVSRNPATGEMEQKHYEVLTEEAHRHKRDIHEAFNNPCNWD